MCTTVLMLLLAAQKGKWQFIFNEEHIPFLPHAPALCKKECDSEMLGSMHVGSMHDRG
jgi:hypothetical protein